MNDMDTNQVWVQLLAERSCLYATAGKSAGRVLAEARHVMPENLMWLVGWALAGQATGHEWCGCSQCGEIRLMELTRLEDERCKMTNGCGGHMQRIAPRPGSVRAKNVNTPGQPTNPSLWDDAECGPDKNVD
jgi:hypothetical protein